jgi:hypothetical protein
MRFQKVAVAGIEGAIVLDTSAKLMWDAREIDPRDEDGDEVDGVPFADAEAHIAKLNAEAFGGFTDWRLPTYHELTGLVDVARCHPAIDVEHFPACKPDYYWTGTPAATSPADYAWLVAFGYGHAHWFYRGTHAFVRAVRPSQ